MTIQELAQRIEAEHKQELSRRGSDCQANLDNAKTFIKEGNKYTKIDIGDSGRYMIEKSTGRIYGIKAYGVIHRGYYFGTLETADQYYWGGYYAGKKSA